MKAAVIRELGSTAELGDVDAPAGAAEVVAAPLNPLDLAVSRGLFFGGTPPLPYVPGAEAVVRDDDGRLLWIFGDGLGLGRNGALAERASIGDATAVELPEGTDPVLASALGIAGLAGWLPLAWRAPLGGGERVLVLGATGSVGLVAVQVAKQLGAGRVVAAGRSASGLERAASLGADATLRLDKADDLVAAFREAFDGEGPDYVFDPVWGAPAAAALQAAAPHARLVNLGQSAGPTAELASAAVRGKNLTIFGHTHFATPAAVLAEHYARLVGHATAGTVKLEVEQVSLDSVADAWRRQADGPGTKLVVVP